MIKHYENEAEARSERDALLTATDWTQMADAESRITHKCVEDFQRYRLQIYQVKHQAGWPLTVDWPQIPGIERQEDVATEAGLTAMEPQV